MQGSVMSTAEAVRSLPRILTGLADDSGTCYITDGSGRARAVLLDIDKYNAMMDAIESVEELPDAKVADALVKAIIARSRTERAGTGRSVTVPVSQPASNGPALIDGSGTRE